MSKPINEQEHESASNGINAELEKKIIIREAEGVGKMLLQELGQHNAFLGTSLDKTFFSKPHVQMYFAWALEHCQNFLLLIDDFEERHNYHVFKGLSEKDATARAVARGKEVERSFTKVLELNFTKEEQSRTRIIRAEELMKEPSCQEIIALLQNECIANPVFREDVVKQVRKNIGGRIDHWRTENAITDEAYANALPTVAAYLMEEIGLSIYLREQMRYPTEVYPAPSMDILRDLYQYESTGNRYQTLTNRLGLKGQYGYVHLTIEKN